MEARGYDDEREYWDDYLSSSANKLKSYQFDLYRNGVLVKEPAPEKL